MCLMVIVQFSVHGSVVCGAGSALWLRAVVQPGQGGEVGLDPHAVPGGRCFCRAASN